MPKVSAFKFTEQSVRQAKPKRSRYTLRDHSKPGLLLRVSPTGSKGWFAELDRGLARKIEDANFMTLTAAWNECQILKANHIQGNTAESSRSPKLTLQEFIQGDYADYAKANHSGGEQEVSRLLNACASIATKRLDKLSEIDIEKWKRVRLEAVKPVTAKRDLAKLKATLNYAVRWRFLAENPAKNVKLKSPDEQRIRFLSDDERKSLNKALESRDIRLLKARASGNEWRKARGREALAVLRYYGDHLTPLVTLVLNTGLRKTEALQLSWDDISIAAEGQSVLTVRATNAKSKKARHVPLNIAAVDVLKKWRSQGTGMGPVFPNPETGLPIKDVKTAWLQLLEKAKIENFRFHDLRHDFASKLVLEGVDLYRVKELLGHSSISVTERYAHLATAALADAVEKIC